MINRKFTLVEAARAGDLKTVQQRLAIKETNINEQDMYTIFNMTISGKLK